MLSSRKWNDGRHWRRFAALFSCSFLIICFLIHKAKGESSMLLKPEIEQNGTSIEGVLYTPNGEGPFPTVILTHGFTGNYTYITGNIAKELAKAGFAAYAFNLRNPETRSSTRSKRLITLIRSRYFFWAKARAGLYPHMSPPDARIFMRWFCTTQRSCCRMTRRRETPTGMSRGTFFRMILPLA